MLKNKDMDNVQSPEEVYQKIAKGGLLFIIGSFSALLIQFIFGIVMIRFLSTEDFGLISLSLTIIQVLAMISVLGMDTAVPRYIGKTQGSAPPSGKHRDTTFTVITLVLASSVILSIFLSASAPFVASLFRKPALSWILSVFALMLTPLALIQIFTALFRGWGDAKAKTIFQDMMQHLIRLLLLMIAVYLHYDLQGVVWIYVAAVWCTFLLYLVYTYRKLIGKIGFGFCADTAKKMIRFALPLLGAGIVTNLTTWVGTLTLGFITSSETVGIFNAPLRLTNIIPIPLMALIFIYLPEATRMVAGHHTERLKQLYVSTTKWAFFLTLPFILFFIIDAEFIVQRLFGEKYYASINILQVMSIGLSFHTFLGPNGMTLVAFGHSRSIFISAAIASIISILFCYWLIPPYGAIGATFSVVIGKVTSNIFLSMVLYQNYRIHPFAGHYIKPLLPVSLIALCMIAFVRLFAGDHLMVHCMVFLVSGGLVLLSPFITGALTHHDVAILSSLEKRITGQNRLSDRLAAKAPAADYS